MSSSLDTTSNSLVIRFATTTSKEAVCDAHKDIETPAPNLGDTAPSVITRWRLPLTTDKGTSQPGRSPGRHLAGRGHRKELSSYDRTPRLPAWRWRYRPGSRVTSTQSPRAVLVADHPFLDPPSHGLRLLSD